MSFCRTCSAPLADPISACPFAAPLSESPGAAARAAAWHSRLSHSEHELLLARWVLHRPEHFGPRLRAWSRARAEPRPAPLP